MSFYLVVIVSEAFISADRNYTFATGIGVGGFGIGVAIVIIRSLLTLRTGGGIIIVRIWSSAGFGLPQTSFIFLERTSTAPLLPLWPPLVVFRFGFTMRALK